jgi:ligand-binding SRPBCC domain-containing protein
MQFLIKSMVPFPANAVWKHFNGNLMQMLTPFPLRIVLLRYDGQNTGDRFALRTGLPGFMAQWEGVITQHGQSPGSYWFIDQGTRLPFPLKKWTHTHILRVHTHGSVIYDGIAYSTGYLILDFLMKPFLFSLFRVRKRKYLESFQKLIY